MAVKDPKHPTRSKTQTNTVPMKTSRTALTKTNGGEVVIGESSKELHAGVAPVVRSSKPKIRTIRSKEKKRLPVSTIFFMIICTMLVMFTVLNFVQINECTQDVSKLKSTLGTLQNTEKELQLELEKKNDLTKIREEVSTLGMMEDKNLTTVHVNLEKEDKIESYETDEEDYGVIATVMSALGQNMRSYWHIFGIGE